MNRTYNYLYLLFVDVFLLLLVSEYATLIGYLQPR